MPAKSSPVAKVVRTGVVQADTDSVEELLQFLQSDSDESTEVRVVRVQDQGSRSQKARVVVGGVPVEGIVDAGADVTVMSGDIFKCVAAVGKLRKCDFKPADKTPYNYDRKPFRVDGRLDWMSLSKI